MFSKNALKRVMRLVVLLGALAITASIALAQDSATAVRGDRNQTARPLPAGLDGMKLDHVKVEQTDRCLTENQRRARTRA